MTLNEIMKLTRGMYVKYKFDNENEQGDGVVRVISAPTALCDKIMTEPFYYIEKPTFKLIKTFWLKHNDIIGVVDVDGKLITD